MSDRTDRPEGWTLVDELCEALWGSPNTSLARREGVRTLVRNVSTLYWQSAMRRAEEIDEAFLLAGSLLVLRRRGDIELAVIPCGTVRQTIVTFYAEHPAFVFADEEL